jgi:hypothetical protein
LAEHCHLLFAMLVCIIMGMGLPTTALMYSALPICPCADRLGQEPFVAHMFIFYFAALATITPPVCALGTAPMWPAHWVKTVPRRYDRAARFMCRIVCVLSRCFARGDPEHINLRAQRIGRRILHGRGRCRVYQQKAENFHPDRVCAGRNHDEIPSVPVTLAGLFLRGPVLYQQVPDKKAVGKPVLNGAQRKKHLLGRNPPAQMPPAVVFFFGRQCRKRLTTSGW